MTTPIVQYVLVRGDLHKSLKWPLGSVVAQACHASVAVIHLHYQDTLVQQYLGKLNTMHKIILEIPDVTDLNNLERTLKENNIDHKVWIEQPENIPTCIAVKPYLKTDIQKYFKSYKLLSS